MQPELPIFNFERLNPRLNGKKPGPFNDIACHRAKVPGGWIIALWATMGMSITFYPDPEHIWDGGTLDMVGGGALPIPVSGEPNALPEAERESQALR